MKKKKLDKFDLLTFKDDWMFKTVIGDRRNLHIVQGIAERCIKRKITKIKKVKTQKEKDMDYESHGVRFDVMFEGDNFYCVIEMQTYKDDLPCRSKYYHDVMDISHFNKGMDYSEMKNTYVIFLLNKDYLKGNRSIYTAKTMIQEDTKLKYDDKRTTIYINPKVYTKDKDISSLCVYLNNDEATDKLTKDIEEAIQKVKKSSYRRKQFMMFDDYVQHQVKVGKKDAIKEGINKANLATAKNLLNMGLSHQDISKATGLSIDKIKAIKI